MPKRPTPTTFTKSFLAAQLAVYRHFLPVFIQNWLQNPICKRVGFGVYHQAKWDVSERGNHAIGSLVQEVYTEVRSANMRLKKPLKPVQFSFGYLAENQASQLVIEATTQVNEQLHLGQLRQFPLNSSLKFWQQAALPRSPQSRALYFISFPDNIHFTSLKFLEEWLGPNQDALFIVPTKFLELKPTKLSEQENIYRQHLITWLGANYVQDDLAIPAQHFLLSASLPATSIWNGYSLYLATSEPSVAERFLQSTHDANQQLVPIGNQSNLFSNTGQPMPVQLPTEKLVAILDKRLSWTNQELYLALLKNGITLATSGGLLYPTMTELGFCLQQAKGKLTAIPKDFSWKLSLADYRKPVAAYQLVKPQPLENEQSPAIPGRASE